MKRILVIVGLVVAFSSMSSVVQAQYKTGDNLLNVGFGLNSYYSGGNPLSISFEHGITNEISAGGVLDYMTYHYSSYNFRATYIGARGSYHFNKVFNINDNKWDVYGGLSLGYRSITWDNGYNYNNGYYGSGLVLGLHIGGKYYFSQKVGAFLELGAMGITNTRLGVAFKL